MQAIAELGLDISREFPKPLTTGQVQAAGIVVTMDCGDACPIYLASAAGRPVASGKYPERHDAALEHLA